MKRRYGFGTALVRLWYDSGRALDQGNHLLFCQVVQEKCVRLKGAIS